jgi:hypothetical protein
MSGLAVSDYGTLNDNVKNITATLNFVDLDLEEENNNTYIPTIYIDKVVIRDMYGNRYTTDSLKLNHHGYCIKVYKTLLNFFRWQFCQKDTVLKDTTGLNHNFSITLTKNGCL